MSNYNPKQSELDELLRQVDSLLDEEPEEPWYDDDPGFSAPEPDYSEYTPREASQDEPLFYQNAANDYGRQIRNYRNHYGSPEVPQAPQIPVDQNPGYDYQQSEDAYIEQAYAKPAIPAYNADFHRPKRERTPKQHTGAPRSRESSQPRVEQHQELPDSVQGYSVSPQPKPKRPAKAPRRPRGCCGCGCATGLMSLVLVAALVVGLGLWIFQRPETDQPIGPRKQDTATILICGTDADGTRTDTMMLLYLSGSEKKAGLLSLPRDTYTIATAGYAAKLNSAYGRNNCGEEGMEALLDYIQDIIGFRPDGYVLVDMNIVPQIVDTMGGVDVEVPQTVETDGVVVEEGLQHLDGAQALCLLRHRASYATADLGRIQVQRLVVEACMKQWVSLSKLGRIPNALSMLQQGALTDLNTRNFLWIGKTMLGCMASGVQTQTLPGYADYIDGASYYLLNRQQVADLINEDYNPYRVSIDSAALNIAP